MSPYQYRHGELWVEDVSLKRIAEAVGTPCYVYSRQRIEENWLAYDRAFVDHPRAICYAVKANGNLAVLKVLADLGSSFDIVSVGELQRVKAAGGDLKKVVFSGVGKTMEEIRVSIESKVACIDVESVEELYRVSVVAMELGCSAPVALRVNPDVDPNTHPYIATGLKTTKFGVDIQQALSIYEQAKDLAGIDIRGIACHIGSQIMDPGPLLESFNLLLDLVEQLLQRGIEISHLDIGGGLGIEYESGRSPDKAKFVESLVTAMHDRGMRLSIVMEPGRSIVADAGVLLTQVEYVKHNQEKNFVIVDAAMNDLIRPALYQAWHDIVPIDESKQSSEKIYDVVGPVCETADVLGKDRTFSISPGDLLAIKDTGAYCAVMASNYNSRTRPAEVMVDGDRFQIVRQRESLPDLYALESTLN